MPEFIENRPITCPSCGNIVMGRESSVPDQFGNTVYECRWICGRCGELVRVDDVTVPPTNNENI